MILTLLKRNALEEYIKIGTTISLRHIYPEISNFSFIMAITTMNIISMDIITMDIITLFNISAGIIPLIE